MVAKKKKKRKEKRKKEKEKGKIRTVFVHAIEAFEVKQGICMRAKCQPEGLSTGSVFCTPFRHTP